MERKLHLIFYTVLKTENRRCSEDGKSALSLKSLLQQRFLKIDC